MAISVFEVVDALAEEEVIMLLAITILDHSNLVHSSLVLDPSVKFATNMGIRHWSAIIASIPPFRLKLLNPTTSSFGT